ncbi:MAG: glycosyl transferase family 1 [Bacteroidota bacterium]
MRQQRSALRRVLVIAYYFPPMGLSGVQRVAKFVKYLPSVGWQPVVLTVEPGGYFAFDEGLLHEVQAAGAEILRTRSIDPTRLFGRQRRVALPQETTRRRLSTLSQWAFVPDNKVGWVPFAVQAGLRAHRARPFEAILSSAPPYSAHLIGALLSRWLQLPYVADFRDDWLGNPRHVYPTAAHQALHRALERACLRQTVHAVAINPHMAAALRARHPDRPGNWLHVIEQGYDPADVGEGPLAPAEEAGSGRSCFTMVYSGVFYDAQQPDTFVRGLALFLERTPQARRWVQARFVGLMPEAGRRLIHELNVQDHVVEVGYVPHEEALREIRAASVLWMTIGRQPGAAGISTSKLYEYIGTQRPILGLVPEGVAADTLQAYGAGQVVAPDDPAAVAEALAAWFNAWQEDRLPIPDPDVVARYDRRGLTKQLGHLLDQATR